MGNHASENQAIKNPGVYKVSSGFNMGLIVCVVIGLAAFIGGLAVDPDRAWFSFVHNHFYFMSLALGGIFFASLQWLTSAMWSAPVRRIAESFTAYLPVAVITLILLYFGIHHIYTWSDATHVRGDLVLEGKSGYLSTGFFMIRNIVVLVGLLLLTRKMVSNSVAQDKNGSMAYTAQNRALSPAFLILFGLGFTMASFDQIMSLDPHWFSTMFGVYCFSGLFYSVLAMTAIVTILLKWAGKLDGIVNSNHIHDLGKYMFAFTVFWAYIGFSQFMLIWYANMPEETMYFLHRFNGGWLYVSIFLLVGKFLVPFFLLLPRDAKRNEKLLLGVGIFMLIAQWIDVLWMVQPQFKSAVDGPIVSWIEIGTALGFLGLFGLTVTRFLAKNNIVAIGDPRLAESVHHHHQ